MNRRCEVETILPSAMEKTVEGMPFAEAGCSSGELVIAECVEEKHQVDFLNDLGCDYIQGYYFGRPMSQDQYEKLTNHDEEEQHDMPQPESS